jgi:hypothetical protein
MARLGKGTKPHRVLLLRIINAGRTAVVQKLGQNDKPTGGVFHLTTERVSQ